MGFSAAVIVTTPQKLAFIDVAKGIRMFARLNVRAVAIRLWLASDKTLAYSCDALAPSGSAHSCTLSCRCQAIMLKQKDPCWTR